MTSYQVTSVFPPIELEKPMAYLSNLRYSTLIPDFFKLSDVEIVSYTSPPEYKRILESSNSSNSSRDFNTLVTAKSFILLCAKVNVAIYSLKEKYLAKESKYSALVDPSIVFRSSMLPKENWAYTTDEDVLKIKRAVIVLKDYIQNYSRKKVADDFENNFINTFKYQVYDLCRTFGVDTRTIKEKASDTGTDIFANIILYGILFFLFILVAKCATGS